MENNENKKLENQNQENEKDEKNEDKSFLSSVKEWGGVILSALVIAAVLVQFIRPTRVDGDSMSSTLIDGDYLIINTIKYKVAEPEKGDIIIFDTDMPIDGMSDLSIETRNPIRKGIDFILHDDSRGKDLVKRIIADEGDRIQISNYEVRVNGELIDEPYLDEGMYTDGEIDEVVPEGCVFVMGDNRIVSLDSRYPEVGFVEKSDIMGKVMLRLLPFSSFGTVK